MSDCNARAKALVNDLESELNDGFYKADTRTILEATCCEMLSVGTPYSTVGSALHSIWAACSGEYGE